MTGSFLILALYALTSETERTVRHRILALLSVCLLISNTGNFIGTWTFSSHTWCAFQGFLVQFGTGNALWVAYLTTHMALTILCGCTKSQLRYFVFFASFISFGYPLATGIFYLIQDMYAPSGPWCFISGNYQNHRMLMFFSVVWGCIIYLIVVSSLFIVRLCLHFRRLQRLHVLPITEFNKRIVFQVISFSVVFLLVWIPPTLNRVYNLKNPTQPSFILSYLTVLVTPLEGFFNFLVYVFPAVYRKYAKLGRLDRVVLNLNSALPPVFAPNTAVQRSSSETQTTFIQQAAITMGGLPDPTQSQTGRASKKHLLGLSVGPKSACEHCQGEHTNVGPVEPPTIGFGPSGGYDVICENVVSV